MNFSVHLCILVISSFLYPAPIYSFIYHNDFVVILKLVKTFKFTLLASMSY